jgi:hypothetical protein
MLIIIIDISYIKTRQLNAEIKIYACKVIHNRNNLAINQEI